MTHGLSKVIWEAAQTMMPENRPLLQVENLHVAYGSVQAVSGVSVSLHAGEIVSIVGANGAGKTSLIRCIAGMVPASAGQIILDSERITHLPSFEVCERGIVQVAEGRQIFPSMSVEENLNLGAHLRCARTAQSENLAHVYATFPRLKERRRQLAGTLSGGEQQMLAIGRALMAQPRVLMFDEPSLGLSPLLTKEMFAVIDRLHKDGLSILLVEQNVVESLQICQRACVLENGRITHQGAGQELLHDDRVRQAYLGL